MSIEMIGSIVRYAVTFGGGFLVTKGWAGEDDVTTAAGAFVALAMVGYSIWKKVRASKAS